MFADVFSYDQELINKGVDEGKERERRKNIIGVLHLLTDEQIAASFSIPIGLVKQVRQEQETLVN
jgi:hypothetical protein